MSVLRQVLVLTRILYVVHLLLTNHRPFIDDSRVGKLKVQQDKNQPNRSRQMVPPTSVCLRTVLYVPVLYVECPASVVNVCCINKSKTEPKNRKNSHYSQKFEKFEVFLDSERKENWEKKNFQSFTSNLFHIWPKPLLLPIPETNNLFVDCY